MNHITVLNETMLILCVKDNSDNKQTKLQECTKRIKENMNKNNNKNNINSKNKRKINEIDTEMESEDSQNSNE